MRHAVFTLLWAAVAIHGAGATFALAEVGPKTEPVPLFDYQRTIYVSAAASDRGADGSRKRPFASLPPALASIENAGPSLKCAILVAEGRYAVVDLAMNVFLANGTQVVEGYDLTRLHQVGNCGGAILIEFDAVPTVANNLFMSNTTEIGDGGAIYCFEVVRSKDKSQPQIKDNVFMANRTGVLDPKSTARSSSGGAIACSHGASPVITGNLIIGNLVGDIVYGNDYSYFKPSIIRNNLIYGNPSAGIHIAKGSKGPLPEVTANDVQGGSPGQGNVDLPPKFVDDGLTGSIADVRATEFTSVLSVEGMRTKAGALVGRVIRIGEKWTVVKANDASSLTVWGNATTDREGNGSNSAIEFVVIPTYTQTADSPAAAMGVGADETH